MDATAGTVRFGDGEQGRVAPREGAVLAAFEATLGAAGNLPAGTPWTLLGADDPWNRAALAAQEAADPSLAGRTLEDVADALDAVAAAGPGFDGADEESVAHAAGRAAEALWAHERLVELAPPGVATLDQLAPATVLGRPAPRRTVTVLDLERATRSVAGTRVARARAWAGLDSDLPCLQAPGTVTVIVLPELPAGRPSPTPGLLRTVRTALLPRRTLGTRLVVVGPRYVEVTVRAVVQSQAGSRTDRVADAIRAVARRLPRPPRRRAERGRLAVRQRRVPLRGAAADRPGPRRGPRPVAGPALAGRRRGLRERVRRPHRPGRLGTPRHRGPMTGEATLTGRAGSSSPAGQPGLERVAYHEGQLLAGRDLTADLEHRIRMRRFHVGSVHDVWGVALGFQVGLSSDERSAVVGPGLAYDRLGREILAPRGVVLDPPSVGSSTAGWWIDLVVRRATLDELLAGRDPFGGCLGPPGSPSATEERPVWRWALSGPVSTDQDASAPPFGPAVRLGVDVPLARFLLRTDGTLGAPDLSVRRNAQGIVRPHIAGGRVPQGALVLSGSPFAWSVSISTASGGFTGSPAYLVSLADHPFGESSGFALLAGNGSWSQMSHDIQRGLGGPFVSVRDPWSGGFRLEVRSAIPPQGGGPVLVGHVPAGLGVLALAMAARFEFSWRLPVPVDWVGVEWVGGCQPELAQAGFIRLTGELVGAGLLGSLLENVVSVVGGGIT